MHKNIYKKKGSQVVNFTQSLWKAPDSYFVKKERLNFFPTTGLSWAEGLIHCRGQFQFHKLEYYRGKSWETWGKHWKQPHFKRSSILRCSHARHSKHQHRGRFSNLVKKLWKKRSKLTPANNRLMTLKKEKKRRVKGMRYSSFSFKIIKKKRSFCTYERKTNLVQEVGMWRMTNAHEFIEDNPWNLSL